MLCENETAPVMPGTSRARLLEMIFSTGMIHLAQWRDLQGDPDCVLYHRFALHGLREKLQVEAELTASC